MTSIDYNDPALWGAGQFFKFVTPGDKISGNLVEVTYKTFEAKDDQAARTVPVFHLEQNDGTIIEVTISHVDLKKQIRDMQPQIGNWVGIKFNRKLDKIMLFDLVVSQGRPAGTATTAADPINPRQGGAAFERHEQPNMDGTSAEIPF